MVGKRPAESIELGENLVTHFPEFEALPNYSTRLGNFAQRSVMQLVGL
jgi:hypothetical protein